MLALITKEIRTFLGSLIGIIVMVVFLLITGLFMWVFPENLLELGYADLQPMFYIAPLVFLFLIPAITMRSIAEEKRTGTLELLLTKPLTEWQVVSAKFYSSLILVIIALLPTLFYLYSVRELAIPSGNVDMGGVWGSYLGLILLAGGFVAIGIFSSSITANQIVAFIIGVFMSFLLYSGFELIASFEAFGGLEGPLKSLGMQEHFTSMGRGVIDLRDVFYFLGVVVVFLLLARLALQSRKW
jgi:ABC-2 type transport system permease protein